MYSDFEDAGVLHALRRLYKGVRAACDTPELPAWVICGSFPGSTPVFQSCNDVEAACAPKRESAALLVRLLAAAETRLGAMVEEQALASNSCYRPLCAQQGDSNRLEASSRAAASSAVLPVCLARLLLGSCCELYAILLSLGSKRRHAKYARVSDNGPLRIYCDSCLASVWTSAHVEYVMSLESASYSLSTPSIFSVPSELSEFDLSDLDARRCSKKSLGNEAALFLQLCVRCALPTSRGWESTLRKTLEKSEASRRMSAGAVVVALTGMHSNINPAVRLRWRDRYVLLSFLKPELGQPSFPRQMETCSVAFRECIRRMYSKCALADMASVAARCEASNALKELICAPVRMPTAGMERGAALLVCAGRDVLCSLKLGVGVDVARHMNECFASANPFVHSWNPAYLGKNAAQSASEPALTSVASEVWSSAFRCNFIPFWVHANTKKLRVTRLDQVQHGAMNQINTATKLTLLLSDDARMRIHRIALANYCSGIMSPSETAKTLGFALDLVKSTPKSATEAVLALGAAGARHAAELLTFARVAAIVEDLLIYDLGKRTREMQARALLNRFLVTELFGAQSGQAVDHLHRLPEHATTLFACVECKRVSNAICVDDKQQTRAFNELGTNGAMLFENPNDGCFCLRCSKRCSASIKTAVAFEEHMMDVCVESIQLDEKALSEKLDSSAGGAEAGVLLRARRDARTSMQQRTNATPCGTENMLSVPLVGNAVRLWNVWYSLCSYCGCFIRFKPEHRHGSEICCLKCDSRMLSRTSVPTNAREAASHAVAQCRFCGKVCAFGPSTRAMRSRAPLLCSQFDPMRSGARWRLVRSPLDTSGANASLPPPLRTVHFCPAHFRSWIPQSMKQLQTRVILSHIVFNARPCAMPQQESKQPQEGVGPKRKTRRLRKNK